MEAKKVGVLGGTFNPIHWGHLVLAETVLDTAGLDELLFVPTALPPHKQVEGDISIEHRLEMVRLATEGQKGFQLSSLEADETKVSYSIDTLDRIAKQYPEDSQIRFIVGADQLDEIESWKDYRRLLDQYGLYVAKRTGSGNPSMMQRLKDCIEVVPMPRIEISSTAIRQRVADGKSIRFMVPGAVEAYIRKHQLYLS